jgi:2',3'-cyclic-nucleotide 2'-phosphodiesterase (5'-nucleotidase family)
MRIDRQKSQFDVALQRAGSRVQAGGGESPTPSPSLGKDTWQAGGAKATASDSASPWVQRIVTTGDSHSALNRVAQFDTALAEVRRNDPTTLYLHNGDALVGTPYYVVGNRGVSDMQALDRDRPFSVVPGNHDLDDGLDNLIKDLKGTDIPLTIANWQLTGEITQLQRHVYDPVTLKPVLDAQGSPVMEPMVQPYRVFTNPETGRKTAVIGLSLDPAEDAFHDPRLVFQDPATVLKGLIPEIQQKYGSDALLIAHTHLPLTTTSSLRDQFPNVQFLAAHDHLVTATPALNKTADRVNMVLDSGSSYKEMGIVNFTQDASGKTVGLTGGELPIDASIPANPDTVAWMAPVEAGVNQQFRQPIAKLSAPMLRSRFQGAGDSELGNWIADQVRAAADAFQKVPGSTDIALVNSTGIRTDWPTPGPLDGENVFDVFPFDNSLSIVKLTGDQVKQMAENSAKRGGDAVSGLKDEIDANGVSQLMVNGKPWAADATYTVAVPDFLTRGGSGYDMLAKGTDLQATNQTLRQIVTNALTTQGTINPPPEDIRQALQSVVTPAPHPSPLPPKPAPIPGDTWQAKVATLMSGGYGNEGAAKGLGEKILDALRHL